MKLPVFGWGFHISEFIAVERMREVDESDMHKMLSTLKDPGEQKCIRSQRYAAENGLPILKNVLLPTQKLFCAFLEDLGGSLDAVYDVTNGYKHCCPTFLDNLFGVDPFEVHINLRCIPIVDIPTSEGGVGAWLMTTFQFKDMLLSDFYSQGVPLVKEQKQSSPQLSAL